MNEPVLDPSAEVRCWVLNGATVVEATAAGVPSGFLVRIMGRWARCPVLEAALEVAWETARAKAHLPAQWTPLEPEARRELERNWKTLSRLPPGQWWPDQPPAPPPPGAADQDPDGLAA